jgi:hypothetical protein
VKTQGMAPPFSRVRGCTTVDGETRGMKYALTELALLLACPFDEVRAWVRTLEMFEPVERDARGARRVTAVQLERIATARIISANRQLSRVRSLAVVIQLESASDALGYLESSRVRLGVTELEVRVSALEARLEVC